MKRYRYVAVNGPSTDVVNCLLAEGWRPVRETLVGAGSPDAHVLVLLERDDDLPIQRGEVLPGGLSLADVSGISLFAGCTGNEIRELLAAFETLRCPTGEVLITEGEENPRLFLLLNGEVEIRLPDLEQVQTDETLIIQLGPGEMFGEVSFFAGTPHGATATATSDVQALVLSRDAFNELLQVQRPCVYKLALNGAATLAERLHVTDRWLWDVLREEQSARIAQSWSRFRERVGQLSGSPSGFFKATSAFG